MEGGLDSPSPTTETTGRGSVFLFRYDNPQVPNRNPNSDTSKDNLIGRWFTDSPKSLKDYIKGRPPGGTIVTVEVPKDKLEELKATNHPTAKEMDIEEDNYILPDELLSKAKRTPLAVPSRSPKNFSTGEWKAIDAAVDRVVEQLQPALVRE